MSGNDRVVHHPTVLKFQSVCNVQNALPGLADGSDFSVQTNDDTVFAPPVGVLSELRRPHDNSRHDGLNGGFAAIEQCRCGAPVRWCEHNVPGTANLGREVVGVPAHESRTRHR